MLQIVRRVIHRRLAVGLASGLIILGMQLAGCSRESSQPQQTPSPPPPTGVTTPAPPPAVITPSRPSDFSLHEPAQRAMPSVVNIFTSKRLRTRRPTLPEGSPLRRFFGEAPHLLLCLKSLPVELPWQRVPGD